MKELVGDMASVQPVRAEVDDEEGPHATVRTDISFSAATMEKRPDRCQVTYSVR